MPDIRSEISATAATPQEQQIAFLIPVAPKIVISAWDDVERNLENTIQSLRHSLHGEFQVVICYHDKPEGSYWDDHRIVPLEVPFEPQLDLLQGSRDKQKKRAYGAAWLKKSGWQHGHIMLLDADDLVNKNLTKFLSEDSEECSWVVSDGIRVDAEAKLAARSRSRFHYSCGSCFVGYFYAEDLPDSVLDKNNLFSAISRRSHRDFGTEMEKSGRVCKDVPFPAVAYITNHRASLRHLKKEASQGLEPNTYSRPLKDKRVLPDRTARKILKDLFSYSLD